MFLIFLANNSLYYLFHGDSRKMKKEKCLKVNSNTKNNTFYIQAYCLCSKTLGLMHLCMTFGMLLQKRLFLKGIMSMRILVQNFQIIEEMQKNWLFILGVTLAILVRVTEGNASSPPIWVPSSFFKAGPVNFVFTGTSATQNSSLTYSSAMVNTNLKVPTMGITNINYSIVSGRLLMKVTVIAYSTTGLTFQVGVNVKTYLTLLGLTYLAIDNSFTPAFSMNYFFPSVNQTGSSIYTQYYVNFTSSTGVTLNTSHENVLLPFLHYFDITTYDNTIGINLNFSLVNGSFYTVIISSTSNMYLNYAGFSRLIFDKTAIEALGSDYFNYGIVSATNNDASELSTIIPPDILSANLYYGLHSFTVTSGLSALSFTSSYNVTSGFIGYNPVNPYVFSKMKFSYMHHKTRTCPAGYPYYNISELLCYDTCNVGWYGDPVTMTCKQCRYDCASCTNASACVTCDATTDFRYLNGTSCLPEAGYYDNNTNSSTASPCTPPCATCHTTGTTCLSCTSGYYLSSNTCASCGMAIADCLICNVSTYCTQCASGLSGASCTSCSSTEYYSSGSSSCVTCSTVISNCQACTSASSCTLCQSTFTQYSSTNCSCTSTQYQSGGTCTSCSSSITYCSTCSSSSVCTGCATTFVLASATSCTCNSSAYLNTSSNSCTTCTAVDPYCSSCTSTACSACVNNITLINSTCSCPSGYYIDTTNKVCATCTSMTHCLTCSSSSVCTSCDTGYAVDATTHQCVFQPCQIANCHTCDNSNYSVCLTCDTGYSLVNSTQCVVKCGDGNLNSGSQGCDDGNSINGDGCSSTCTLQTGFTCVSQYVNVSNTYSYCYYSSSITFTSVWIRKMEGSNTLKFQFQLGQNIQQWSTVDFTSILTVDTVDPITNFSTGLGSTVISSYSASYSKNKNRFSVMLDYKQLTMESQYLSFSLTPYANNVYPAFTPPVNVEFFPPYINCILKVVANNNQNANLYSSKIYGAYSISVSTTYAVVGIALLTLFTSLVFRAGKIITFQMITILQLTYFSLSFLDSINPVFSGLLPLRYLAGILNFKDVDDYLDQITSPNSMKGIYMFLNLSDNFTFIALSIVSFLGLGCFLLLIYSFIDWLMNKDELGQNVRQQERTGYSLYKLAFHFIGELALSLIIICLPLYSISMIFQAFYLVGSGDFWSYAMGIGIGFAIVIYFVALIKQKYPKDDQFCKFGDYLSEFTSITTFQNFKYVNLIIINVLVISTIIILTIYSNNKLFATIAIIFISLIDVVIISVIKPYKFGFVSCFKGEDNNTESMFEKIELYKVYDKEQPQVVRIQNPDLTQKSEENDNNSEVFAQHFATRKNMIKTKHQGLIQGGQILNHSKLFLFNNNFRRIFNLITLIVVQFVFACTAIFSDSINKNYDTVNIQVALPFLIHSFIFLNVIYNYAMLILQILNRTRQTLGKVENEPADTSSQFMKSLYSQKEKASSPENTDVAPKSFKTNQEIIKTNQVAKSLYDLKRPKIIQPFRTKPRKGRVSKMEGSRREGSRIEDNPIDEEED